MSLLSGPSNNRPEETVIHIHTKVNKGKTLGIIHKNPKKSPDLEAIAKILKEKPNPATAAHRDYAFVLISENVGGHVIEGRDEDKEHLQKPIAIVKHFKKGGHEIKQLAPERVTIKTYSNEEFNKLISTVANNSLKELKTEPSEDKKTKIMATPRPNERRLDRHVPKKEENKEQIAQALAIDSIITESLKDARKKQENAQKRTEEQNEKGEKRESPFTRRVS